MSVATVLYNNINKHNNKNNKVFMVWLTSVMYI